MSQDSYNNEQHRSFEEVRSLLKAYEVPEPPSSLQAQIMEQWEKESPQVSVSTSSSWFRFLALPWPTWTFAAIATVFLVGSPILWQAMYAPSSSQSRKRRGSVPQGRLMARSIPSPRRAAPNMGTSNKAMQQRILAAAFSHSVMCNASMQRESCLARARQMGLVVYGADSTIPRYEQSVAPGQQAGKESVSPLALSDSSLSKEQFARFTQ